MSVSKGYADFRCVHEFDCELDCSNPPTPSAHECQLAQADKGCGGAQRWMSSSQSQLLFTDKMKQQDATVDAHHQQLSTQCDKLDRTLAAQVTMLSLRCNEIYETSQTKTGLLESGHRGARQSEHSHSVGLGHSTQDL